ncbi:DsrE family protein [Pararhodobacter zhoushanensis]|uniref:DsrE family protein n=1 Tax=Pararhodobacter zhoushanensis TaxID=2479545 RepID=A0ABT3GV13_9RHOB|nr:DsrE family protein [Pararhodobacter zhoushanensis]MCW1931378.1 DsrE family protein [Pararhodobacter zhoushanensis]
MITTALRGAGLAALLILAPLAALAEVNRVAIHLDENDPARMNMVLNNANNIIQYYEEQGEEVEIQIVTYGPGLNMLRADTSPVADRISQMSLEHENISFQACNNTLQGMQRQAGHDISLMPEAQIVPSGAVHLIELQQQGWAYLRP